MNASIAGHDVRSRDNNCPKDTASSLNRLIGSSNETTIQIEGVTSKALIDSGSMVNAISEEFYNKQPNRGMFSS